MFRLLGVFVASALALGASATTAPAGVIGCHVRADFNVLISSARNMSCKAGAQEMRRYRGSIARSFRTPGGFACYRVSGGRLAGQWRCVRGLQAFRFEFSD